MALTLVMLHVTASDENVTHKIIKHAIEASGLNVTEAAKGLGVTRQTLSRLINTKTSLSPEMAIRASKAFGSTAEHC